MNFLFYFNKITRNVINETILSNIFISDQNVLKLVIGQLVNNNEPKKKSVIIIDNLNLILRHFDHNPIFLIHFVIECSRRPDIFQLVFIVHEQSLNIDVLNQIRQLFQTVVYINDTKMRQDEMTMFSKLSKYIFKFSLKIDHRSWKTSKVLTYVF